MAQVVLATLLVLIIIYLVPIVVYGSLTKVWGLQMPTSASPITFLLSVLVSKTGTAIAIVLIFYLGKEYFINNWLLYAIVWWVMFVLGEVGQAVSRVYSWKEALAGVISETVYLPVSAYLLSLMLV